MSKKSQAKIENNAQNNFPFSVLKYITFEVSDSEKNELNDVIKQFKKFDEEQKSTFNHHMVSILFNKQDRPQIFKKIIEKYLCVVSSSMDWRTLVEFCEIILSYEEKFSKFIIKLIFEIFDQELVQNRRKYILSGCLSISVECAFLAQKNRFDSLLESITSEYISRSNCSDNIYRIASVTLFAKIQNVSSYKVQKVLERFGSTILDYIFNIYFVHKEESKSKIAFDFIEENMHAMFVSSVDLAENINSILNYYMLKNYDKFINFLKEYKKRILAKPDVLYSFLYSGAFLIKSSFETCSSKVSDELISLYLDYIFSFKNKQDKFEFAKLVEVLSDVLSTSSSVRAKEVSRILYHKVISESDEVTLKKTLKLLGISAPKSSSSLHTESESDVSIEQEKTASQKILLLCS